MKNSDKSTLKNDKSQTTDLIQPSWEQNLYRLFYMPSSKDPWKMRHLGNCPNSAELPWFTRSFQNSSWFYRMALEPFCLEWALQLLSAFHHLKMQTPALSTNLGTAFRRQRLVSIYLEPILALCAKEFMTSPIFFAITAAVDNRLRLQKEKH